MSRPEPISPTQHRAAADALERVRVSGLTIYDASLAFKHANDDLEWALGATDPEEKRDENYNWSYADKQFAKAWPRWVEERDNLRFALENDARNFTEGCG